MKRLLCLLIPISILCFALNASAVLMRPLSVQELTTNADLVLEGTVLNKICLRDESGQICTKVHIRVNDIWKGTLTTNEFTISHLGGTVGDERLEGSGQVEYEVGEEIVAFLELNSHGEGVTIGLLQGKFHVLKDEATGEKLAENIFHGRSATITRTPATVQPRTTPPKRGRLTIADLKSEVQAHGAAK